MNKALIAAVIAFGSVSMAHAADPAKPDEGHGKISFKGSIIDAPCSIAPGSDIQEIDLGQISKVALDSTEGRSTPKGFTIQLEKCSFDAAGMNKKVKVTFSGARAEGDDTLLGLTGTTKGAGLALTDGSGTVIKFDTPTKEQTLQKGDNSLNFTAYLQSTGASGGVTPGDFKAVTEFTLEYL